MRRLAALVGIFLAAVFAGVLVVRAGPEHDTTQDGYVDLRDALDVLSHFGEAPGTPTPQLRETHIPILHGYFIPLSWAPSPFTYPSWYVRIDGGRYPPGTTFRLDVHAALTSNAQYCWSVFDLDAQEEVAGSDVCVTVTAAPSHEFISSGEFTLPSMDHSYALRAIEEHAGYMDSAQIVASWSE
jgi:hypothetical protein